MIKPRQLAEAGLMATFMALAGCGMQQEVGDHTTLSIGIDTPTLITPTGPCGVGAAAFLNVIKGAIGYGQARQDEICVKTDAAKEMVKKADPAIEAVGVSALAKMHPEFNEGQTTVQSNLRKGCAYRSSIQLTDPDMCNYSAPGVR